MVDPAQVSAKFGDGLCPCRGCTAARKRVVDDLKQIFVDDQSQEMLDEYWKSIK